MSTLALLPLLYPAAPLHAVEEELKLPPMHHAVKMVVPQGMKIDPQVRLNEQDEIDCISCHGIEDIAEIPLEEIDSKSDDFFVDGPYPTMGALCARCHNSNESERTNIHILLDKDGKLIEDRCTFCHMEVPDTQAEVVAGESRENTGESTRENAALRLPAQKLCFGCHLKTPHINADNHLVEISNESSNAMPGEMVDHLKQESEKSGYRLPLSEGYITCITCHTSHQRGVIKPKLNEQEQVEDRSLEDGVGYADHPWGKVVAADRRVRIDELVTQSSEPPLSPKLLKEQLQYRRLTHEVLLRAPAKDGTLCLLCHSFEK
ncbi:MAG: hypothetical protein GQ470_06750 [Gammaproteobacteria bacterium]|nr:hypothetical protein [Gammaproteobacteria bacterium]